VTPYYEQDGMTLYLGDCREVLPELLIVAAVTVTSPPYWNARTYEDEIGWATYRDYCLWLNEVFGVLLSRTRWVAWVAGYIWKGVFDFS
jgi:DNA modification methylase